MYYLQYLTVNVYNPQFGIVLCWFFTCFREQHKLYQAVSEIGLMENILEANFHPFWWADSWKKHSNSKTSCLKVILQLFFHLVEKCVY